MSSIVENQRSAYVHRAMSSARNLADDLANISPAQRAAVIATLVAATSTNVDLIYLSDDPSEARECHAILDGHLAACRTVHDSWSVGGNCLFSIVNLKADPHE